MTTQSPSTGKGAILVIAPQPFYEDRGTPIAVLQLLRALTERGERVDLLTFPVGADMEIPGVRVIRVANPLRIRSVPIGFSLRKVLLDLLLTPEIRRRLRSGAYRCVHAVEESAFPAAHYARPLGIPVIYDMQSYLPEQMRKHFVFRGPLAQRALRRCVRRLVRRSDRIICSSGLEERVRALVPNAWVREWRFAGEFAEAVPAEEIARQRERLGIGPERRVILYCGTFESYQGLDLLAKAIPEVMRRAPEAFFLLVGAGERDALRFLGLSEGMSRNGSLRILPRRPRRDLSACLALADVAVSPRAFGDNLPLKVFDYMTAGLPIAATDIMAHRRVLNEERAVLARPEVHALTDAIVRLIRDREEAVRLGAAARVYAEAELGWPAFVGRVADLYEGVTGGAKSER
ncbi:MAG: glycosyltransferase family 4 protein [Candidatus Eisenbacteria bacterium]|nr:glycosyltransferase family 4 protein [Candidatus Eisenbacteria bacterium]